MISQTKCTLCGRLYPTIHCGTKTKSRLKQNEERAKEHICQYCKRKGTDEFVNTHPNHQQHRIYFSKED